MKIIIEIDTSNAAFLNADELENLLQKVGERITNGQYTLGENWIRESNGNRCGSCLLLEN